MCVVLFQRPTGFRTTFQITTALQLLLISKLRDLLEIESLGKVSVRDSERKKKSGARERKRERSSESMGRVWHSSGWLLGYRSAGAQKASL